MRPFLCPPTHKIPVFHNTAASIAHLVLDLRRVANAHAVDDWLQNLLYDSNDLWLDDAGICPRRSLKTLRVWYHTMLVDEAHRPKEALFNRATQTVEFRDMKTFHPTPLSNEEHFVWVNQLAASLVPSRIPLRRHLPWRCPGADTNLPTDPDASPSSPPVTRIAVWYAGISGRRRATKDAAM